jgi:DivIVA domain-containing protein
MAITPLDIHKMTFPKKLRGYESEEVQNFLGLEAEMEEERTTATIRTLPRQRKQIS